MLMKSLVEGVRSVRRVSGCGYRFPRKSRILLMHWVLKAGSLAGRESFLEDIPWAESMDILLILCGAQGVVLARVGVKREEASEGRDMFSVLPRIPRL